MKILGTKDIIEQSLQMLDKKTKDNSALIDKIYSEFCPEMLGKPIPIMNSEQFITSKQWVDTLTMWPSSLLNITITREMVIDNMQIKLPDDTVLYAHELMDIINSHRELEKRKKWEETRKKHSI